MPDFIVTNPQGQKFKITAPDGASQDQVMAYAQSQFRDQQTQALKQSNPGEYDPNSQDFQDKYGPTSGMNGFQKAMANLGAGTEQFGLGAAQLLLPKSAEHALGITDQSINERRARDNQLAQDTTGGRLLQWAGAAAPTALIPGGLISKGLTAIPKIGGALGAIGIGSKVLPTLMAEGGVLGGVAGAATPTTSNESTFKNAALGALTGAAVPAALAGVGKVGKFVAAPFSNAIQRTKLAPQVAETLGPNAESALQQGIAAQTKSVVDAPMSTAAMTQSPEAAALELGARANPATSASWQRFDELARDGRWKALDAALGNSETVNAAKEATNEFAQKTIPKVLGSGLDSGALNAGVQDLQSAVQGRLNSAVRDANPGAQEVYGFVKKSLDESGKTPQALWNIRKTLSSWMEGTPPPGVQTTRAPGMDTVIQDTKGAIDNVLNRSTQGKWSNFLNDYADYASKEAAQKAGLNIRNTFMDETLGVPRGVTTPEGSPIVTRAALERALVKHGQGKFGELLDWPQRNVVDQVLGDLHSQDVLTRAKASMTGGGGSMTAPLQKLMQRKAIEGGGWMSDIANALTQMSGNRQRQVLSQVLQSPSDALALVRTADALKRPLSGSEQKLIQAARTVLTSPTFMAMGNQDFQAPPQQVGQ